MTQDFTETFHNISCTGFKNPVTYLLLLVHNNFLTFIHNQPSSLLLTIMVTCFSPMNCHIYFKANFKRLLESRNSQATILSHLLKKNCMPNLLLLVNKCLYVQNFLYICLYRKKALIFNKTCAMVQDSAWLTSYNNELFLFI